MKKQPKASIKRERMVITYAEFWVTANVLLDRAKSETVGSYHQSLASLVFLAFTLEAYLNHLGEQLFPCWTEIEKTLQPKGKIALICEKLSISPQYDKNPWQVVPKLGAFRNKIAHGKNALLVEEGLAAFDKYDKILREWLLDDWQKEATVKKVDGIKKQLEALLQLLHTSADIAGDCLFALGGQTGSAQWPASPKDSNK